MSQRKRGILGFVLATVFLGIAGCGGGGSSTSSSSNLPQTSAPPTVTFDGWVPNDAQLTQYKPNVFSASAVDPNIGGAVTEFQWDFGDGKPMRTTPAVLAGGKASATCSYAYSTAATSVTLSVVAKNGAGKLSKAATHVFTVSAGTSPFTVAFTNPAVPTTINPAVKSTYILTYQIQLTYSGTANILPTGIVLDPGDPTATVGTPADLTGGKWAIPVTYIGADTAGSSRDVTPAVTVSDSAGISSDAVKGSVVSIKTVNLVNTPPKINLTLPATDNTVAWTSKSFDLGFTLIDADNDPVSYTINWGDGTPVAPAVVPTGDFVAGVPVTASHTYADALTATSLPVTITVSISDNRDPATKDRKVTVKYNTLPTATIITPQPSSALPVSGSVVGVTTPPGETDPDVIVVPVGGQLIFDGTSTLPSSGDALGFTWSFPGGTPSSVKEAHPGQAIFSGGLNAITPNLVSFTAVDAAGRSSVDPRDQGAATGGTVTTLADSTKAWAVNQWTGFCVKVLSGTGAGQIKKIISNTPTTLTWTVAGTAPDGSSKYQIIVNPKDYQKWILVDGVHTQQFTLSFQYRQKSDNNGSSTLAAVVTAPNGLGAKVQIFQDGTANSYSVQDQVQVASAKAIVSIPVRSNLPFYIKIPSFGADTNGYMMRIPNEPTGDPSLTNGTPVSPWDFPYLTNAIDPTAQTSTFGFQFPTATTGPWNPTLNIVTAQGFAAESALTNLRSISGSTSLVTGTAPPNQRWLSRVSVPISDTLTSALPSAWNWASNNFVTITGGFSAYQAFADWPIMLETLGTSDTTAPGTSDDLKFKFDFNAYQTDTAISKSFAASAMQAFRVPKNGASSYDLNQTGWGRISALTDLNPTPVNASIPAFFKTAAYSPMGNAALAGGLRGLSIPYDPTDKGADRVVLGSPLSRNFDGGVVTLFGYSEYLWTKVWSWPLVLNSAILNGHDSYYLDSYSHFRFSDPLNASPATLAHWPSVLGISASDTSSFNLNANGGSNFDPTTSLVTDTTSPAPSGKAAGHFYWTVFSPSYEAMGISMIARTWLAQGSSDAYPGQPPTTFSGGATDATAAFGFVPPQDAGVDKRTRKLDGSVDFSVSTLNGYRVNWFNPTINASGNPVAPDFWVIELNVGGAKSHFMLPGNYPATYPAATVDPASMPILTDARTTLVHPTDSTPLSGKTVVAPGYCWFDVPLELRPATGSANTTITVYAVKSVLSNHAPAGARPLNRPEWIEAIKTSSAAISLMTDGSGRDLSNVYKIPFNYYWDIVITNGPITSAPQ